MSASWRNAFRAVTGFTGVCEVIIGLTIVFFAGPLQPYLNTTIQYEPLYLRILGMLDASVGAAYICIALQPEQHRNLNQGSCLMRLCLSLIFFAEGFWLLEDDFLRLIYQFLAFFDLGLFVAQAMYLHETKCRAEAQAV